MKQSTREAQVAVSLLEHALCTLEQLSKKALKKAIRELKYDMKTAPSGYRKVLKTVAKMLSSILEDVEQYVQPEEWVEDNSSGENL